jgi:hypothetical protein
MYNLNYFKFKVTFKRCKRFHAGKRGWSSEQSKGWPRGLLTLTLNAFVPTKQRYKLKA